MDEFGDSSHWNRRRINYMGLTALKERLKIKRSIWKTHWCGIHAFVCRNLLTALISRVVKCTGSVFKNVEPMNVTLTTTNIFLLHIPTRWEIFGVQCFAQAHLNMWTERPGNYWAAHSTNWATAARPFLVPGLTITCRKHKKISHHFWKGNKAISVFILSQLATVSLNHMNA